MSERKDYSLIIVLVVVGALFLGLIAIFYPKNNTDVAPASTLVLSPSPSVVPTAVTEPFISSWKPYTNEKFGFILDVPADWYIQDYAAGYPNGGTVVAFSPNPLPCETCAYFRNGYFSIRIYNETTDSGYYKLFLQKQKSAGKSKEYQQAQLGKKPAIASSNAISAEYEGWVYEFALDINEGKSNFMDSPLFMKAASSFTFTGLQFEE